MTSPICIPANVSNFALETYFKSHVRQHSDAYSNIFTVVKPLHVFKIACSRPGGPWGHNAKNRLINLIIPVGEHVHATPNGFMEYSNEESRKMRASAAVVHSISLYTAGEYDDFAWPRQSDALPSYFNPARIKPAAEAFSDYDSSFRYVPGQLIKPKEPFAMKNGTCLSGIHFFLNVRDALEY